MSLTGAQTQQLQAALLSAFDQGTLAQMVRVRLEENLSAVAGGSNLNEIIFNLIAWAERTDRVADLIAGASAFNPHNPKLNDFAASYATIDDSGSSPSVRRSQLAVSLLDADREGYAKGEWTPWGDGGAGAYFYHLNVKNLDNKPAKDVWVELKTVSIPGKDGSFQNTLSRRLPLRKPNDGEERSPGSIRAYDDSTWNFGFLASHLNQFQLDIYKRDWPLNFQGIVKANGCLRVEIIAVTDSTRSGTLCIEIRWDGGWIENDPDAMKQHLHVREVRD